VPGGAILKRWGLLDKVMATNPGVATGASFDIDHLVIKGSYPALDGVNFVCCPRRYILDKILVDTAVEAGVDLRENFITEEILFEQGRAAGIRGRTKTGSVVSETAHYIIGADGKNSLLAQAVKAPRYNEKPVLTCAYYSYWSNLPVKGGELYGRGRRSIGVWPTNDNLTVIYVAWPVEEFNQFRSDVEGNFLKTIELIPALAERVHQAKRVERIAGSASLPNFYRKPYGPGWALVGDAGLVMDPITGAGMGQAFQDAERLATALDDTLAGRLPAEKALETYENERNQAVKSLYDFTVEIAAMQPPKYEQTMLFEKLQHNQPAADLFFGLLTGVVPAQEFFSPRNLFRIMGLGGMLKIALHHKFGLKNPGLPAQNPAASEIAK
jgi:2-polyprenyl-6-methoxyphenol hydroxylase-like FAD-dependent oxidoreductase